jgi:hypothetical protein
MKACLESETIGKNIHKPEKFSLISHDNQTLEQAKKKTITHTRQNDNFLHVKRNFIN